MPLRWNECRRSPRGWFFFPAWHYYLHRYRFCRPAITETKQFARWLVEELEERMPGFEHHLKLHITGCPNSCGQHWISDIGIEGKKLRVDGQFVDAYYFCLGGAVGAFQTISRPLGYRCTATTCLRPLNGCSGVYLSSKQEGEPLRAFFARHRDAELRAWLAGTPSSRCSARSSAGPCCQSGRPGKHTEYARYTNARPAQLSRWPTCMIQTDFHNRRAVQVENDAVRVTLTIEDAAILPRYSKRTAA